MIKKFIFFRFLSFKTLITMCSTNILSMMFCELMYLCFLEHRDSLNIVVFNCFQNYIPYSFYSHLLFRQWIAVHCQGFPNDYFIFVRRPQDCYFAVHILWYAVMLGVYMNNGFCFASLLLIDYARVRAVFSTLVNIFNNYITSVQHFLVQYTFGYKVRSRAFFLS